MSDCVYRRQGAGHKPAPFIAFLAPSWQAPTPMGIIEKEKKSRSENSLSTIRKFSRRVQGTGLVKTARAQRYFERKKSKTVQKKRALKLIKSRADYQQAVKEGKIIEREQRGPRNMAPRPQTEAPRSQSGLGDATPIAR